MGECSASAKNEFDYMEKLDPKPGNGIKKNKLLVVPIHIGNYADSSKTTFQEAP